MGRISCFSLRLSYRFKPTNAQYLNFPCFLGWPKNPGKINSKINMFSCFVHLNGIFHIVFSLNFWQSAVHSGAQRCKVSERVDRQIYFEFRRWGLNFEICRPTKQQHISLFFCASGRHTHTHTFCSVQRGGEYLFICECYFFKTSAKKVTRRYTYFKFKLRR